MKEIVLFLMKIYKIQIPTRCGDTSRSSWFNFSEHQSINIHSLGFGFHSAVLDFLVAKLAIHFQVFQTLWLIPTIVILTVLN